MINKATNQIDYLKHARQNQFIEGYTKKNRVMLELPVCPKCERAGLRTQGWAVDKIMQCPHCGFKGKATMMLRGYLKDKLYK